MVLDRSSVIGDQRAPRVYQNPRVEDPSAVSTTGPSSIDKTRYSNSDSDSDQSTESESEDGEDSQVNNSYGDVIGVIGDIDDVDDEEPAESSIQFKEWGRKFAIFLYISLIHIGIPIAVYYYALSESTILVPYWTGYASLILTNSFKLAEGISAAVAYIYRRVTKPRRTLLDTETQSFVKVYETDFDISGRTNRLHPIDYTDDIDDSDVPEELSSVVARLEAIHPHLLILVPAYLVNEQDVIKETIIHMGKVTYSGKVDIVLVYNTPDFPEKDDLIRELTELSAIFPTENNGKNLHIHENVTSHSKAENVNYGLFLIENGTLPLPDIVAMYDADHQPELWSWERVVYTFAKTKCDVVQGRCVIRNNKTFFAKMIAVEYELMYTLHQKGGGFVRNYGIFGGSNGFWKYEVLAQIKMDESMLTEDIDSNFRTLESGFKVIYSDDVISYELTPPSFSAWVSQRLRWSQGWFEVTFRHTHRILKCSSLSWRQRLMSLIYLPFREINIYLMAQILPAFLIYLFAYDGETVDTDLMVMTMLIKDIPTWVNTLIVAGCTITDADRWATPKYTPVGISGYLMFIFFSPFYLQALLIISMIAHCRHFIGMSAWVVTPR